MDLPIDVRTAPIKTKYLDEETPMLRRWFIFGSRADGTVDINDGQQDIFIGVKSSVAISMVMMRDLFVDNMLLHINGQIQDA